MKMSNIASNASYLVSGGSFIFWVKELIAGFTPDEWTVSGLYALALKRELRICKGRLDEIISWRQSATCKQ